MSKKYTYILQVVMIIAIFGLSSYGCSAIKSGVGKVTTLVNKVKGTSQAGVEKPHDEVNNPGEEANSITMEIKASKGGTLDLGDKANLRIPAKSLGKDGKVTFRTRKGNEIPGLRKEMESLGEIYEIEIGGNEVKKAIKMEIPFDPEKLPSDVAESQVFLVYYDEETQEWIFAGGEVDSRRNTIEYETEHASFWQPVTWNWGAWRAIISKELDFSLIGLIDANLLMYTECAQSGKYVKVDASKAGNLIQGCVEKDDAKMPTLRIINPTAIFIEGEIASGGGSYFKPKILSPGASISFEANTKDRSPMLVAGRITEESTEYMVVHMFISMMPGLNQVGIETIACYTERLKDTASFFKAAEALMVENNGPAAIESLMKFMLDEDAMRRFIEWADDCHYGPAKTWSYSWIVQMASAINVIGSEVDFFYNYFTGNTYTTVAFDWSTEEVKPIEQPTEEITSDEGMYELVYIGGDGNIWITNLDGGEGIRVTSGGGYQEPAFSPDGEKIAFIRNFEPNDIYKLGVIDLKSKTQKILTQTEEENSYQGFDTHKMYNPNWTADGQYIYYNLYTGGAANYFIKRIRVEDQTIDENFQIPAQDFDISTSDEILFNYDGGNLSGSLSHTDVDGMQTQVIRKPGYEIFYINPRWNPDGYSFAVFVSGGMYKSGAIVLGGLRKDHLMVVLPLDYTQFNLKTYNSSLFDWTPDGKEIIFEKGERLNIFSFTDRSVRDFIEGSDPDIRPTREPVRRQPFLVGNWSTVKIGDWDMIYNPEKWEEYTDSSDDQIYNTWGYPGLKHRSIEGCVLVVGFGHGVPDTWTVEYLYKQFGYSYVDEDIYTDTRTDKNVLLVFSYFNEDDNEMRAELRNKDGSEECIADAEEIVDRTVRGWGE